MNKDIKEVESEMYLCLKNHQYNDFIRLYNIYMSLGENTSSKLYFKAFALLYYLSINEEKKYYNLLQTVKINEVDEPYIKFVLEVTDLINAYDINKLNELSESNNESANLLKIIIQRVKESTMSNMSKDIKYNENKTKDKNIWLESIKDCVYICKNHNSIT